MLNLDDVLSERIGEKPYKLSEEYKFDEISEELSLDYFEVEQRIFELGESECVSLLTDTTELVLEYIRKTKKDGTQNLEQERARVVGSVESQFPFSHRSQFLQKYLGHLWFLARLSEEAERCFSEAINRYPNDAEAIAYRAHVRFELGRLDESVADAERAIRLDPNDITVLGTCALLANRTKNQEIAVNCLERAMSLYQDNPEVLSQFSVHKNLAIALFNNKDFVRSIRIFSDYLSRNSDDSLVGHFIRRVLPTQKYGRAVSQGSFLKTVLAGSASLGLSSLAAAEQLPDLRVNINFDSIIAEIQAAEELPKYQPLEIEGSTYKVAEPISKEDKKNPVTPEPSQSSSTDPQSDTSPLGSLETEFFAAATPEEIGNLLLTARNRAGMSQNEVAKAMGVDHRAVRKLEKGEGNPTIKSINRYLAAVGMKAGLLLSPAP